MAERLYGITGINLYSRYSATAHVEGEGLGSLLELADSAIVSEGERYAYGLSEMEWQARIIQPGVHMAVKTIAMWIALSLPSQFEKFVAETQGVIQAFPVRWEPELVDSPPAVAGETD
jgi:hypothetical protein